LVRQLRAEGHEVRRLVRRQPRSDDEVNWAPASRTIDYRVMDEVDAVINLSGASISRIPWTPGYRKVLRQSRIDTTRTLTEAMNMARTPPRVFISASAVGFYGDRPGERLTEVSSAGEGFLCDLVAEWEQAATLVPKATRVVQARSAAVIGAGGGALTPLALFTRLGLATRFGTGGQHWSWISRHDEAAALIHLLRSPLSGPVNLVGPVPATFDRVAASIAREARRWYLLRAPEWVVRLLLGEAGQHLLLDSAKVIPTRLAADGFAWAQPRIEDAVAAAFSERRARA
tara:strand:- start:28001 stop:28861 length:861 start_codon:yes stop_codon:yes gene_type:complete